MNQMQEPVTLSPTDLNPTDRLALELLREGRCTAAYIADVGDYSTGNVRTRLKRLLEHGHVERIHDGLYELVDDPDPPTSAEVETERVEETAHTPRERSDVDTAENHADTPSHEHAVDHATIAAGLDLEGSGSTLDARREAVRRILDTLRELGSARKSELLAEVDPTAHGYKDLDSLWSNLRRQKVFDTVDVVETPGQGGQTYHYRQPDHDETETDTADVYDPTSEFE